MAALNMLKLADVLSTPPRPGANRDDCTDVAVVYHSQPMRARVHVEVRLGALTYKLELGLLTRVRRGESGFGGIGACALLGIVSVSRNIS